MRCTPVTLTIDGEPVTMIACTRGRSRPTRCSSRACGGDASLQCDYSVTRNGKRATCDRYCCPKCSVHVDDEVDHCDTHTHKVDEDLVAMRRRCTLYHERNPAVWEAFAYHARTAIARDEPRTTPAALWERVRLGLPFGRRLGSEAFAGLYADRFDRVYPDLAGWFVDDTEQRLLPPASASSRTEPAVCASSALSTDSFRGPELFDLAAYEAPADAPTRWPTWFNAGPSSTSQHRANVAKGRHPFGLPLGDVESRCGKCVHLDHEPRRRYPKCKLVKRTRGAATDVRLRWRGCETYEPKGTV